MCFRHDACHDEQVISDRFDFLTYRGWNSKLFDLASSLVLNFSYGSDVGAQIPGVNSVKWVPSDGNKCR